MQVSAQDVEQEHYAALMSLTFEQRRALHRIKRAEQMNAGNHRWLSENLEAIFAAEAEMRSTPEAGYA